MPAADTEVAPVTDQLLTLELPIPHHGWQPGRPRKAPAAKKPATKG